MNRNLKIAFTLSLLLNVFFLGVGASWGFREFMERPVPVHSLNPELSHDIAKSMIKARREHESLHQDLKTARQAMNRVLAQRNFNEDEFRKAAQKIDEAQQALYKARTESMLKMARDMTPEDRQQMAKRMQEMSERRGGGQGENLEKLRERLKERRAARREPPPAGENMPPPE
ncbi:MAG: periplasmic heavy metal sensor [Micavibrio aeruginosavorus]|uniref:Periplasmic heavy metal sensor n=1 Tax=Micavibrio aeruginosavorus TaxID=349221 RepID=A0A7T5R3R3_9BACT|nr:MAG: periplasmic heavy metal sensor [Micavibrio aeruginosavorus]